MAESKGFVIAIDGPVASGKGTLAEKLARDIGGFYLHTGAIYRCIALMCIQEELNLDSEEQVGAVLENLEIELNDNIVFLNKKDVTDQIKAPSVANGASAVAIFQKVRDHAVSIQRKLAEKAIRTGKIVVAEGRDTGSIVFPDAMLKVFLTASPEVRARRRMEQYGKLSEADLVVELERLKTRDSRDTTREISPLPREPESLGYFIVDNSNFENHETLDTIKSELKKRKLIK